MLFISVIFTRTCIADDSDVFARENGLYDEVMQVIAGQQLAQNAVIGRKVRQSGGQVFGACPNVF